MKNMLPVRALALAALIFAGTLHAQVPPLIHYQGRVAVDAVNFEGSGLFKFALVNAGGTITLWSNDLTSAAGSEPVQAVTLDVSKGLYSVLLGDVTLLNMASIPLAAFTDPDVRLRVWFDDGVNGSQLLDPDQRLATSAYLADGAVKSASMADGAIIASKIAPGAITTAAIEDEAILGSKIAPSSLDASHLIVPEDPATGQVLGFNGATLIWTTPGTGGGVWALNGTNAFYNTGNVGIGTNTPTAKLDVRGHLTLDPGASPALFTGTGGAELNRYLSLINSPSSPSASGLKAGGVLVADSYSYADPAKNNLIVKGNVAIGTPTPGVKLVVKSGSSVFTGYGIEHTDGTVRLTTFIDGIAGWIGTRSNHELNFFYNDGLPSMTIGGGGVVIPSSTGFFTVGSPNAESGASIQRGGNRADVRFNGSTLKLYAAPGSGPPGVGNGVVVSTAGNVGIGTESPSAKLHVVGTTRTSALTISGGVDLAEPFEMKEDELEKGSVVVIDDEHPGHLKRSTKAYDTRVAGIISGANGINPGISLHQEGVVEGGQNVALSGRVYVKANTSMGRIEPGDLLTTSDVPGEAMKAGDVQRRQGAILGKAMTPLQEGSGPVLVLVTLQ